MADPATIAELQARITTSWGVYMNMAARLSPSQVEAPDHDGWSPKDQVAHVADWERVLLAMLNGEPRANAVAPGVTLTPRTIPSIGVEEVQGIVVKTRQGAEKSGQVAHRTKAAMDGIEQSSQEIGSIVNLIDAALVSQSRENGNGSGHDASRASVVAAALRLAGG